MGTVYRSRLLRRLLLPLFSRWNPGDVTIRHPWCDSPFRLHSFRHKGYWYHGRNRKKEVMLLFPRFVRSGDFVIEIGGHIGWVAVYLAHLVGPDGRLVVFEPDPANLTYLRRNASGSRTIAVVGAAVSDDEGRMRLYRDPLSGQNSSLFADYASSKAEEQNRSRPPADMGATEVSCTTLDAYLQAAQLGPPVFVKIDAEGAEFSILRGMRETLRSEGLALMVEVTRNAAEVHSLLSGAGFGLFRPDGRPVESPTMLRGNVFCIRPSDSRIGAWST